MKKRNMDWQEKQTYLFSLIEAKIPKSLKFTDVIEGVLDISTDAVYRRINGKTELKFDELCALCSKFDISMDKIMGNNNNQDVSLQYSAINPAINDSYTQYLHRLSAMLTGLSQSEGDSEFFFTASDIPFYYFPDYPELLYFKLYERCSVLNNANISYEDFCTQLDKDSIMPLYTQVTNAYMEIPSTEIWSVHTISKILQSLKYYVETECFENKATVLLLLKHLSELIKTVEKDADEGNRKNKKSLFSLYISPVDVANNIMLIRNGCQFDCDIRLFAANSFFIKDNSVCYDIHKEINDLKSRSILVSARLKHERRMFFRNMQDEISCLTSEIKQLIH
jgi:hypothetical protein